MDADLSKIDDAQRDDGAPVHLLLERYRGGPELVRASVAGFTPEQLHAYPVPGKMSAQEVVCHIVDADQYLADRLKRTIATARPLLIGVESVLYIEPLHYRDRDLSLDLVLLEATRAQMAADLERLPPASWLRDAIHSETGLVTLRQLLLHAIVHLEGHVEAIHSKRVALGL